MDWGDPYFSLFLFQGRLETDLSPLLSQDGKRGGPVFPLFGSLQRPLPTLQACSLLQPGSPKIAQVLLLCTVNKIILIAHNQHLEVCFQQQKQIEIRISSGTAPSACLSKQAGCQTRVEFFLLLAISSKWWASRRTLILDFYWHMVLLSQQIIEHLFENE